MNTKSFAVALVLAAGFAASAHASNIVTLDTVQVRPSADQLAQAELERSSAIPTLSSVQVRPTAGQIVELAAEQAAAQLAAHTPVAIGASIGQWMVSLPAITVRPDARQVKALATELAADTLGEVANGMVAK
ncbi:MAG: hypothetical protein ABS96_21435 [Lysobacteraceae bacterium SCN 69-123]|jgi:outer membrane protein W|uniref:hypothetical protein n=1 Tax=Stenotrophomonas acidaminiphila TaxID=128780 RepID=UPI00086E45C2|nr:hypothetical protein [Stenotrophomonas acidaminiphila]MBN8801353.1 hypothetical protein [Stenotrophomonas acidaminiphila]MDF9440615.1 hypothetical protein [Stenotrophomonas acidaminiphila]ODU44056.1 MAG: hypothetical protein ABS96_21435 [Xanthomonadaceae bacterium SCN 69-123]OJY72720.1 MAG: hypothetical protein BGP18_08000 [Stenotrophomonas sp. 69-14]